MVGFALVGGGGGPSSSVAPIAEPPTSTTAATTPAGIGEGWAAEWRGRSVLRGFGQRTATITSAEGEVCEVCLLAASTDAQRARGLMEVTDPALGGHDGMVFVYDAEVDGAFWMRNTPMPLSIAYFDERGAFVSDADMAPCGDVASCPSYPPDGAFRYALEVPAGGLDELGVGPGSVLALGDEPCPRRAAA